MRAAVHVLRTRKARVLLVSLAGLVVLHAVFGFLVAPGIIRNQIEEFGRQHFDRAPALGEIDVNPFTLTLQIREFSFDDSTGAPLLAFDRLLLNLSLDSLWKRGLSFDAIELDRPEGHVLVRQDGTLNLAEFSAPFAQDAPAEPAGEPARVFIDRLRLRAGAVEFQDLARGTPFRARLTPVDFELIDFSTTGSSGNRYSLQASSTAGERLNWTGNFGFAPFSSRGSFELSDVQARTLWSYLQESLGFEIAGGTVKMNGNYEVAASEPDLTAALTLSTVEVAGLGVRPRGGEEDWIHIDSVAIENARLDAARRSVDVAAVRVNGSRLVAHRAADGKLNLLTLLQSVSDADGPPPAHEDDAGAESAWTVNVPVIELNGLLAEITDEFVEPAARLTVAPANFRMSGFSTSPEASMDVTADMTLASGGRLQLNGKGQVTQRSFEGKFGLDQLNLAALQPYVGAYTQMTLLSGLLSVDLDVRFDPAGHAVSGKLESTRLHTIDNALREDFIKWDRIALDGIDYRSAADRRPASLHIGRIAATAPYVRFIIAPDQTINVARVLTRPGDSPGPIQTVKGVSDRPTGAQGALDMRIGRVQVRGGSANFADFWITPNYAVSLQQLEGSVTGLSSRKDSRARLSLAGRIDRYAPIEIAGELNLLSASLYTDIRVKFDGVELTSVTPYSGRFAGYRIEKGKLSVDVRYQVENRKLNAEQRFRIDQLTLGERVDSPDAVNLPLRLAVALLKDRNGVIDLGLPVTGSLDDPKFRLGPIVWKAFVNLLAGVATSPFKLLGSVFGGGEEVNLIDFDAGSAELTTEATTRLASLTRALHERPQLSLEVPAIYSPDADFAALASRWLDGRLRTQGGTPGDDAARRFELLLAIHRADKPDAALPPAAMALQSVRARDRQSAALDAANRELERALLPGIETLARDLEALAQQRARNIQDALLTSGEGESARVFLVAPGASPAVDGRSRAALTLK
jgi:hypothetical protein